MLQPGAIGTMSRDHTRRDDPDNLSRGVGHDDMRRVCPRHRVGDLVDRGMGAHGDRGGHRIGRAPVVAGGEEIRRRDHTAERTRRVDDGDGRRAVEQRWLDLGERALLTDHVRRSIHERSDRLAHERLLARTKQFTTALPYSRPVVRPWALCTALVVASSSHAGGLVVGGGSPRSIGRAGAGTVSDDGAGALLVNPAALARREGARAQLGVAFTDDEVSWLAAADAPIARNQSASDFAPTGAAVGSVGPWVIGLAAMTASVTDRALRSPSDLPPNELGNAFEYRYAGIAGAFERDAVTAGVARRLGDNFAAGLSVGVSRVTISERRRVWAGFTGRDVLGDPELDVETSFAGTDWFVPSVTAGLLYAPSEAPLELAVSAQWLQTVTIDGDASATTAGTARAPSLAGSEPTATLRVRQPVTIRAGARYIGDRFVAELGGDLWIAPDSAAQTTWRVSGLRVVDRSGVEADLARIPSRLSMRTHGAVRGAADVEIVDGFLWATAGYAYQVAGVAEHRQSPAFGDLGGHTLAFGLEGTAGGFTLTLGWSRTWSRTRRVTEPVLALDNPFAAGDGTVAHGTYDGSVDQVGILVDAEWDAPE